MKRINKMLNTLIAGLTVAVLVGCAHTGNNFNEANINQIKKGETTEQDLVQLFGSPLSRTTGVTDSKVVTVLTWEYIEVKLGPEIFSPIPIEPGSKGRAKTLTVVLNSEGRVDTFSYAGGTSTDTGTHWGNQKK